MMPVDSQNNPRTEYEPEIVLASALRMYGADLLKLAGVMMIERLLRLTGDVTSHTLAEIDRAVAALTKAVDAFKARKAEEAKA